MSETPRAAADAQPDASGPVAPGALSALLRALAAAPAPPEDVAPLRPGQVLGRFEIVRELGRGGFGVVYEARDRELGRRVAVKALRAGGASIPEERLLQEAEAAARLSHPNIVTLHDVGRWEGGPFLVLELLRGEPLSARLDAGTLAPREALRIGVEVARGLAHAHARGVVHRDLTPCNVFLCEDGEVKLLDFGMAHAFGRRTVRGGTRPYMAPEQWLGAPEDERTDVFALGVVLYQMLSGELPFADPAALEDARAAPAVEVPAVPALGALVARMLEKDPVRRPRDAEEVLVQLEALLQELAGGAALPAAPARVRVRARPFSVLVSELRRRRVFRALVAYGLVAFAILQVVEPILHGLRLPDALLSIVVVLLGLGFPITVALAWAFDLTAGGIERAPRGDAALPRRSRLALLLVGLGLVAAAPGVAWYVWQQRGEPVAAAAGATAPSIAVLPFADLSPGRDQEYFSDGIAEEILNALAQVDGLHVVGRTSSFAFKGKSEDLRSIGQKLRVTSVLEGSVRREAGRVRITAQLVNVADGYHVWSRSYDHQITSIIEAQGEIAEAVVAALRVKLVPRDGRGAADRARDPQAYDEFLLGRRFAVLGSQDGLLRAAASYERALALDPRFAEAAAHLAIVRFDYADLYDQSGPAIQNRMRQAMDAAERAVALDPSCATGYAIRAYLRAFNGFDWEGAQADLARAISLNPGDGRARLTRGQLLQSLGRLPEAAAALRQAVETEPLSPMGWWALSYVYAGMGQLDEARAAAARSMEVAPEDPHGARNLGLALLFEGRFEEAAAAFERSSPTFRRMGAALVQHGLGRAKEARLALDELVAQDHFAAAYQIAQVHAWRGEKEQAFAWLERAYAQRDSGLADYVRWDPMLRGLRDDPRYVALLRKMKLRD